MPTEHTRITEESIDYELYPFVTGKERFSAFEEIRTTFSSERSEELLLELEEVKKI